MSRIGVFDSGLGGLTCVKELMRIMPHEDIVYFGDTLRVPYGNRSPETILAFTKSDIDLLMTKDVKLIVAACGTASAVALDAVKDCYPIPIIGVVKPSAKIAANITRNNRIGIIGTSATIASNSFNKELSQINSQIQVFGKACPLFVPLIENGYVSGAVVREIAQNYLLSLKNENVDTFILGCTHYRLINDIICDIMGESVKLIDTGYCAAHAARDYLVENGMENLQGGGGLETLVSDKTYGFSELSGRFLGREIQISVVRDF